LIIAAPDHWHTPAALLGLANGKNVYVEKPCSQNPYEGEMLIQAVNKYKKILQVGSQRRSFPSLIGIAKEVHDGLIGTTYMAKSWYAITGKSIGIGKKIPVPSILNFELWQGLRHAGIQRQYVHYNWHCSGTGEQEKPAIMETMKLDCCRWFLDVDFPTKVTSAGGRYAFTDDLGNSRYTNSCL